MSQGRTYTVNTVQSQKLPRAVQQLATARGLGLPEASYLPRNLVWLYALAGSLLLAVGVLILFAFAYFYADVFSWWPRWQALSIPGLGLGWLAVGLWVTLSPLFTPPTRVFVFSNGFVWLKRKPEAVLWEELEKLWKRVEANKKGERVRSYIVRTSTDAMYLFNEQLPRVEQLGARMEQELTSRLLPATITLYVTGVPLIFGDIILSVQGLGVKRGRRILPWKEVEKMVIDDTFISVYTHAGVGKTGSARSQPIAHVARVPNVEVLRGLMAFIKDAWRPLQSPYLIAYNAGTEVFFGALSISQQGVELHAQRKFLPWSEIASVSVGESEVLIRKHSQDWEWYTIPAWTVSDIGELRTLVAQIVESS